MNDRDLEQEIEDLLDKMVAGLDLSMNAKGCFEEMRVNFKTCKVELYRREGNDLVPVCKLGGTKKLFKVIEGGQSKKQN